MALSRGRLPGPRLHALAATLVALTLAFLWVGIYGYRYNQDFFNTPGLNWWAFLLWRLGSAALSWHYSHMAARLKSHWRAVVQTLLVYGAALLVVEYAGYVVFGIHEISHHGTPLVLDLIHGTPTMWVAYMLAPILNTYAYLAARHHLRWAAGPLSYVVQQAGMSH